MSHVAEISIEVKDLDSLKEACRRLGLEFVEGQKTYRWWGFSEGDYPLPAGFTAADLGLCDHAIRVPENHPQFQKNPSVDPGYPERCWTYEIGVVKRRDGKPGFCLLYDFFGGGFGLEDLVGKQCNKLRQTYATVTATRAAMRAGFRVHEHRLPNGSVQLRCIK
jgi:hypothetical protein